MRCRLLAFALLAPLLLATAAPSADAARVQRSAGMAGVEVFPFSGESRQAREVGLVVSLVLDRALGNSPAFPARLRHTTAFAEIRRSMRQTVEDPATPREGAEVIRRADETAAVCGNVTRVGSGWQIQCRVYDRQGAPRVAPVALSGSLSDIEDQLPKAAEVLAARLSLPAGVGTQVAEWADVPAGALSRLIQALATTDARARVRGLLEAVTEFPDFSLPVTLALETAALDPALPRFRERTDDLRTTVLEQFDDELDALLVVARYDLAAGETESAALDRARGLCPTSAQALRLASELADQREDYTEGVTTCRRAAAQQPHSATTAAWLAEALLSQARAWRAGVEFDEMRFDKKQRVRTGAAEALKEAQRALSLDGNRADIWAQVAACATEAEGQEELARSAFEQAYARNPYSVEIWSSFRDYFGPEYLNRPSEWRPLQRRLLTAPPGTFDDYYRLGDVFSDHTTVSVPMDPEVNVILWQRALSLRPNDGEVRARWVAALIANGEVDKAAREFARLDVDESLDESRYALTEGLLLRAKGDALAARDAFRRAQNGHYFWDARLTSCIAETYVYAGELKSARETLEPAYAAFPHWADVDYLLAYVYHQQGKDADAQGVLAGISTGAQENVWITPTITAQAYPLDGLKAVAAASAAPPNPEVPAGWKQVFADDFMGSELRSDWRIISGEWKTQRGELWATDVADSWAMVMPPGEYPDVQVQVQVRCDDSEAWAAVIARVPEATPANPIGSVRAVAMGTAELENLRAAGRAVIRARPVLSAGDWWWVRMRVQGDEAALWVSRDGVGWRLSDWGKLAASVPASGRVLLCGGEFAGVGFRHLRMYAPAAKDARDSRVEIRE